VRRLVLVGLPATGKTTVARALGDEWQIPALDTDDIVAQHVGMPAGQYLRTEGEAKFRERELDALRSVIKDDTEVIVATGGGIVSSAEARALLSAELTLWLDSDDEVLLGRLGDVERPLLDEGAEALARLRAERDEWYREVSRARIDTAASIDEVVARVAREVDRLSR
jgi:shikimate kinase